MNVKILLPALVFLLFTISLVSAHQPRFVEDGNVTVIKNPEISQAFYSELNGQPQKYTFASEKPFRLFISIVVPDIPGSRKDISARVSAHARGQTATYNLNGSASAWPYFFEEYGGDGYLQGPELNISKADAGTYEVEVFSPGNKGKYSLAVGYKEEFPMDELIKMFTTLPKLKQDFFGKPWWTIFSGRVGIYIAVGLVLILFILMAIYWSLKGFARTEAQPTKWT